MSASHEPSPLFWGPLFEIGIAYADILCCFLTRRWQRDIPLKGDKGDRYRRCQPETRSMFSSLFAELVAYIESSRCHSRWTRICLVDLWKKRHDILLVFHMPMIIATSLILLALAQVMEHVYVEASQTKFRAVNCIGATGQPPPPPKKRHRPQSPACPAVSVWLGDERPWYVQPCLCDWAMKGLGMSSRVCVTG